MKRIFAVLLMMLCVRAGLAQAEPVELTEKMTPQYYDDVYRPHVVAAEKAASKGKYLEASAQYVMAAELQTFAAHRGGMYRNAAYELLKHAQTGVGPAKGLKYLLESEALYEKASHVLELADEVGGRDESRALTKKHINMGLSWLRHLKANPEKLSVAREDL